MTRFTNRLRVLLTGLALLGLSRPVAAETQLVFSTPPGGAVFPLEGVYVPQRAAIVYSSALAFPFYLTRAGSSTPLEIDVRAFRQIRVFSSQQGGAIVATLEVWENGEPIGDLGTLEARPPSATYDTPGRTLRVRIDNAWPTPSEVSTGAYTGPVPPPPSTLPPPPPPPVLRLTIYGTPG